MSKEKGRLYCEYIFGMRVFTKKKTIILYRKHNMIVEIVVDTLRNVKI